MKRRYSRVCKRQGDHTAGKVTVMFKQAGILVSLQREFREGLSEAICALKPERQRASLVTIWGKNILEGGERGVGRP